MNNPITIPVVLLIVHKNRCRMAAVSFYAGYILVISSIMGIAREKILISQGYRDFLDRKVSTRQPPVRNRGKVTAV